MKPRPSLAQARAFYAEGLRLTTGSVSSAMEDAFAHVPREKFLHPPPWRLGSPMTSRRRGIKKRIVTSDPRQLYHDVLVALDRNRNNGMPSLWFRLFEAARPMPGERVLHAGCGTGYYTAILSRLVGPGGRVIAVEIHRATGQRARSNLAGLSNVDFVPGDATEVDEPVDLIAVSAGVALPPAQWFRMLRPGGRVIVPFTGSRGYGASFLFTKRRRHIAARFMIPVGFSPCASTRDEAAIEAADEAISRGQLAMRVKRVRLDEHPREDTCWLHTASFCLSQ